MFDQLPDDIKLLIFSMNRKETSNEIKNNKLNFLEVMYELEGIRSLTLAEFYDEEEEDLYTDMTYTFSMAMLECIRECEIESQMEQRLDHYLENGCD